MHKIAILDRSYRHSCGSMQAVKKILRQCYGNNKEAVSDELVQYLLDPGMQAGSFWPLPLLCLCTFITQLLTASCHSLCSMQAASNCACITS